MSLTLTPCEVATRRAKAFELLDQAREDVFAAALLCEQTGDSTALHEARLTILKIEDSRDALFHAAQGDADDERLRGEGRL